MEKLDKVIAGLECCAKVEGCLGCPYLNVGDPGDLDCINEMAKDALEVLREVKPVVEIMRKYKPRKIYNCPDTRTRISEEVQK